MKKVIIDTDVMIDDWMAILFLLAHDEIEVIGISVSGTGGTFLKNGSRNVKTLLKIFNLDFAIPVCEGLTKPLLYSNAYPKKVRLDSSDFYGLKFPISNAPLSDKAINKFYDDLLVNSSESVIFLTIGGGTNLGSYIEGCKFKSKIEAIINMGGAIDVKGNLKDLTDLYDYNDVAEWNCFIDPKGINNILTSNVKNVLVPLDICNKIHLRKEFINRFKKVATKQGSLEVSQMMEIYITFGMIPIFDPLVAVIVSIWNQKDFEKVVETQKESLSVVQDIKTSGEVDNCAQVYRNKGSDETLVCYGIKQEDFEKYFLEAFIK